MVRKFCFALLGFVFIVSSWAIAQEASWTDKVDLGMDFRYRHEMQDASEEKSHPRHRQRIRARLSVHGEVDESVTLHLRLSTGSSSERSTIASGNETLGDGGANDPFWVDKAYMQWKATEASTFHLGKFSTPFYRASKSQLIWDSDFTPEGFAYKYRRKGNSVSWFFNMGAMWLDENDSTNDTADHGIFGGQLGAEISLGEPVLVVAVANHTFPNLKDSTTLDGGSSGSGSGNSTYTATGPSGSLEKYLYDYNLLEGAIELRSKVAGLPSSVYINYVQNQEPDDDNMGYLAGFRMGQVKDKGDWAFIYNYRKVEKDAVIASLADSDFADGKTDIQGHTVAVVYGVFKNSDIAVAYFDAEREVKTTKNGYTRAHVDFSFKF